jgi:hypothetical protein
MTSPLFGQPQPFNGVPSSGINQPHVIPGISQPQFGQPQPFNPLQPSTLTPPFGRRKRDFVYTSSRPLDNKKKQSWGI